MRFFKLHQGFNRVFPIEKEAFERATFQKKPYYNFNASGQQVQFAVCPHCDNPIEIIGLYKKIRNTPNPYGKHYPSSIPNLATYNQQAYEYCPFAKKQLPITPKSRKPFASEFERNIYYLMREQFDRVIYLLSKEIDIKIGTKSAKKMLEKYVKMEGWLYPWSTLNNLPWMLGHLSLAKNLYMQPIKKGSELYDAILKHCPNVSFIPSRFNDYDLISPKQGVWLNIEYCIISHQRRIEKGILIESVELQVRKKDNETETVFFSKTLTINEQYFFNLIHLPEEKSRRNKKLLDIAKELMPDLE